MALLGAIPCCTSFIALACSAVGTLGPTLRCGIALCVIYIIVTHFCVRGYCMGYSKLSTGCVLTFTYHKCTLLVWMHYTAPQIKNIMNKKNVTIDGVAYTLTPDTIEVEAHALCESTVCNACYGEIEDGAQLTVAQHINAENDQKLTYGIIHADCAGDVSTDMFLTLTYRYHDWSSETAEMYDAMWEAFEREDDMDAIAKEYLEKASELTHSYRDIIDEALEHVACARYEAKYNRY